MVSFDEKYARKQHLEMISSKCCYENDDILVVHNPDQFQIIKEGNYYEGLWLKLNTGMNRLGFDIDTF